MASFAKEVMLFVNSVLLLDNILSNSLQYITILANVRSSSVGVVYAARSCIVFFEGSPRGVAKPRHTRARARATFACALATFPP